MIRYHVSEAELLNRIESFKPGWLNRSRERTKKFKTQGFYKENSSIWNEVKTVYIQLQNAKCAYCEKQLEDEGRGLGEHDVEHFRPKSTVAPWKPPPSLRNENIPFTKSVSSKGDPGYHLLAYHHFNYATACRTCNSALKRNKFPIAGIRDPSGEDPTRMKSEKHYLIYPISDIDEDPERLIKFFGLSPYPVYKSGHRRNRALVTIEFFELDHGKREKSLFRNRARLIASLYSFLVQHENARNKTDRDIYQRLIDIFTAPSNPHTNCGRSFLKLFNEDRKEAENINRLAAEYLSSISN